MDEKTEEKIRSNISFGRHSPEHKVKVMLGMIEDEE
jgi:hypothetical protein